MCVYHVFVLLIIPKFCDHKYSGGEHFINFVFLLRIIDHQLVLNHLTWILSWVEQLLQDMYTYILCSVILICIPYYEYFSCDMLTSLTYTSLIM